MKMKSLESQVTITQRVQESGGGRWEHRAKQAAVSKLLSTLEMEYLTLERGRVFVREVEKHRKMYFFITGDHIPLKVEI